MCVNYGTRLCVRSRLRAEVKEPGILHTALRTPAEEAAAPSSAAAAGTFAAASADAASSAAAAGPSSAASPAAAAAAVPPAALGADGAPAVAIEVHALHWSLRPPRQEAH